MIFIIFMLKKSKKVKFTAKNTLKRKINIKKVEKVIKNKRS